jgi:hypothetical protein
MLSVALAVDERTSVSALKKIALIIECLLVVCVC